MLQRRNTKKLCFVLGQIQLHPIYLASLQKEKGLTWLKKLALYRNYNIMMKNSFYVDQWLTYPVMKLTAIYKLNKNGTIY